MSAQADESKAASSAPVRTNDLKTEYVRPTGVCASSGKPIAVGDRYVATLVEVLEDVERPIHRLDYTPNAWENRASGEASAIAVWRSVMPDPGAQTATLDAGSAMELFTALEDVDDDQRIAFRYVLALMLVRKKKLIHEGGALPNAKTGEPGELRVRRRGTEPDDIETLVAPVLDPETIDRLAKLVEGLMHTGGSSA